MGVFICFESIPQGRDSMSVFENYTKSLVHLLAGPFVHTEMLVATPTETSVFTIHLGGVFCKTPFDPAAYKNFTLLALFTSPEEDLKILQTCEACVTCKIKYNTKDMLLHPIPFRTPEERCLAHSPSLYCAQSMVLILRECLESDNPLLRQIGPANVHSRTVTPTALYDLMHPLCLVVLPSSVSCQTFPSPSSASTSHDSVGLKSDQPKSSRGPKKETWDRW